MRRAAPQRGGELIFGRYADSLFLDPVLNDANVDIWILTNLYDTLLLPTADGKGVSRAWPPSGRSPTTALTVTLTLRDGVKFADGSPITAEDVKWSLDRARDPNNGIWNFLIASIDSIEAAGSDRRPQAQAPRSRRSCRRSPIFNTAILPKKQFEAEPGATDDEKAKSLRRAPDRLRPVRARRAGSAAARWSS